MPWLQLMLCAPFPSSVVRFSLLAYGFTGLLVNTFALICWWRSRDTGTSSLIMTGVMVMLMNMVGIAYDEPNTSTYRSLRQIAYTWASPRWRMPAPPLGRIDSI